VAETPPVADVPSADPPLDLDIEGLEGAVEIGLGGFATVYKASQPAFGRTVAVKVLDTQTLDEGSRARFERECQAMGTLSEHPNIVTVYGAGFTKDERPYLLMGFLSGGSLQDRLDNDGPLPWEEATVYAVALAGALETAHRANIVHRDIKPGNVLMSSFGEAELTDFGIARISGGHETRSSMVSASFAHAPPEVLDGKKPAITGDVYSLGSTVFELITGKPAFESGEDESLVPMLRRVLNDAPPDLRERGVPDEIAKVIEKAMAKKPEDRQQSAVEFGHELMDARRALGLDPGKLTVPAEVARAGDQTAKIDLKAARATAMMDRSAMQQPKSNKVAIGVALGALILAAVAVLGIKASSNNETVAPPTTPPPTLNPLGPTGTLPSDYNPQTKESFITACVNGGPEDPEEITSVDARTPICECTFTEIRRSILFPRWLQITEEVAKGNNALYEADVVPIVKQCEKDNPITTTSTATVAPATETTAAPVTP
jgi:serine/threonine protein kinase